MGHAATSVTSGSGANTTWTEVFDPAVYRVALFDRRGCGRSTPNAAQIVDALIANTTQRLIAVIESVRAARIRVHPDAKPENL